MKKSFKLDQSRLLGFKIQPKLAGSGMSGIGAKIAEPKIGGVKMSKAPKL